jgi:glucose-1-phosphate adenylyltransferase
MKILALVLAGGEGARLYPLTAEHAKPAVPFVNGCRFVDFVLSNLVNSKISTIYILAQYKPESLIEHIDTTWAHGSRGSGRIIKVVLPRSHAMWGQFKGTADAVYQNLDLIEEHQPDLVAVFASDHVYRMDVRQMVDFHEARGAEVTVAAVPVPIENASSFGVIKSGPDGEICEFQEKPVHPAPIRADPGRAYASMGNYLFDPHVLVGLLEEAARYGRTDFGRHILPTLPGRFNVFAYDLTCNYVPGVRSYEEPAYWRDVGTLNALSAARNDVVGPKPRFNLWNSLWPIRGEERALTKLQAWGKQSQNFRPPGKATAESKLVTAGHEERREEAR